MAAQKTVVALARSRLLVANEYQKAWDLIFADS